VGKQKRRKNARFSACCVFLSARSAATNTQKALKAQKWTIFVVLFSSAASQNYFSFVKNQQNNA
jgi:hypothetical protein